MKTRGFTLIEVCITIVVLAILIAIAVPSMATIIGGSRVKSAKEDVLGTIAQARSEAIKTNTTLTVILASPTVSILNGATTLKTVRITGASGLAITPLTFAFNSVGAESTSTSREINITPSSGACSAEVQCSRVQIFGGGLVKACNPSQGDSDDPAFCL